MTATASAERKAALQQLLRDGVHCAVGLKESLQDERCALEQLDTEALHKSAASKQALLTRLEKLEGERRELCVNSGYDSDPAAMEQLVNSIDPGSSLTVDWTRFVGLAKECDAINTRNGAIINLRRQQVAGALSVVQGKGPDNETYSRTGQESAQSGRRILAEI